MNRNKQKDQEKRVGKRWSKSEDLRLVRQVQAFPQNLHRCFVIVAEELGRTEDGVAKRWYKHISHDPGYTSFFALASPSQKDYKKETKIQKLWKFLIRLCSKIHF